MTVEKIELKVVGERTIHCNGCERTIERDLSQVPGVVRVEPSHETQRIQLALDDERISLEAVQKRLRELGWKSRSPAPSESPDG